MKDKSFLFVSGFLMLQFNRRQSSSHFSIFWRQILNENEEEARSNPGNRNYYNFDNWINLVSFFVHEEDWTIPTWRHLRDKGVSRCTNLVASSCILDVAHSSLYLTKIWKIWDFSIFRNPRSDIVI